MGVVCVVYGCGVQCMGVVCVGVWCVLYGCGVCSVCVVYTWVCVHACGC